MGSGEWAAQKIRMWGKRKERKKKKGVNLHIQEE